jgi:hypothetical protein
MPDQSGQLTDQELDSLARAVLAVPLALRARSRWSLRERHHRDPHALSAPDGTKLSLGGRGVFIGPDLADFLAIANPELIGRLVAQVRHERGLEDLQDPDDETEVLTQDGSRPQAYCYSCASYHAAGECASGVAPNRFFARGEAK